jgi:hypothetical protein
MIIFNSNIARVTIFRKRSPHKFECSLKLVENFKKKVGRKFLFFPVYEIIQEAVVNTGGVFSDTREFVCELKDYKSDYYYFEDGVLYEKPHCVIHTNDKHSKEVHFETVEELEKFVDELKSKAPHIEV